MNIREQRYERLCAIALPVGITFVMGVFLIQSAIEVYNFIEKIIHLFF